MNIGLDSCAIIDFFRGNQKVKNIIFDNTVFLCDYTYLEVLIGAKNKLIVDSFFNAKVNFPITKHILKQAIELYDIQKQKGKEIPIHDCIIVISFITNNITTIVSNDAHMKYIDGINIITY